MRQFEVSAIYVALSFAFGGVSSAADMSKDVYKAAKPDISGKHTAACSSCDSRATPAAVSSGRLAIHRGTTRVAGDTA